MKPIDTKAWPEMEPKPYVTECKCGYQLPHIMAHVPAPLLVSCVGCMEGYTADNWEQDAGGGYTVGSYTLTEGPEPAANDSVRRTLQYLSECKAGGVLSQEHADTLRKVFTPYVAGMLDIGEIEQATLLRLLESL
jgi:hypothetical protein